MSHIYDAIIVGAGLAGLACAQKLQDANKDVLIVDKNHHVGGRLCTDIIDGFRLDHGFQVLNTAYSNAQDCLDFEALKLGQFLPGARIYAHEQFHDLIDPLRAPSQGFKTLLSKIGTIGDKLRILTLRRYCAKHAGDESETRTTLEFLNRFGFTPSFIETFFQPFYAGIFLENKLSTSAAVFIYTFDRFSQGLASIPSEGMAAIPKQLASKLTQCDLRLGTEVVRLSATEVHTANDETFQGRAIILATPFHITNTLLRKPSERRWKHTRCMYFAAPHPPIKEAVLVLNGNMASPINLVCVPSNVAPTLAPDGQHLINVSLNTGHEAVSASEIMTSLRAWFGACVEEWRHLKTYDIPYALPSATPQEISLSSMSDKTDGYYVCGDHCTIPTIDHALGSGISAAAAVLKEL